MCAGRRPSRPNGGDERGIAGTGTRGIHAPRTWRQGTELPPDSMHLPEPCHRSPRGIFHGFPRLGCRSELRRAAQTTARSRAGGRSPRQWCRGQDLNLHGQSWPLAPQASVSANSTTSARGGKLNERRGSRKRWCASAPPPRPRSCARAEESTRTRRPRYASVTGTQRWWAHPPWVTSAEKSAAPGADPWAGRGRSGRRRPGSRASSAPPRSCDRGPCRA